ncbi:MAG: RDD family protein [Planctomycetota bacterium]
MSKQIITDAAKVRDLTIAEAHTDMVSSGKRLMGPAPRDGSFVALLKASDLASPARRLGCVLVDALLVLPFVLLLYWRLHEVPDAWFESLPLWMRLNLKLDRDGIFRVGSWLMMLVYLASMLAVFRRTPGQMWLRVQVLDEAGRRPGFCRALFRALMTTAMFLACGQCMALGALFFAISGLPVTAPQDSFSRTWVVKRNVVPQTK